MIEGNNYCPNNPADRLSNYKCHFCEEEFDDPGVNTEGNSCCPYCSNDEYFSLEPPDSYSKEWDE